MSPWEWFTSTTPAGAAISAVGVGAFVIAILSDRLMTMGQHKRRVADITTAHDLVVTNLKDAHAAAIAELVAHHDALAVVKATAYDELKQSRDYYREARLVEIERANKVTEQLAEVAELAKLTNHLLGSLDEVAKDART
jgi:hypothetical protein